MRYGYALERSLITERTRAGITAARKRAVKFGRKPKLDAEQLEHARKMLDRGKDRQHVARILKVSRTTLYRALASRNAARYHHVHSN